MITEDYVNFETAKLLKEKGFDECPLFRYDDCGQLWVQGGYDKTTNWHFPAPTLQMVMKWLREVYNKHCHVSFDYVLGWYVQIVDTKETAYIYDDEEMKIYHPEQDCGFNSYEEACEAAIRYTLENLI